MNDEKWMRLAIETAREGIALGQSPFGAAIVRDDQLIVAAHNIVLKTIHITAHAEITAIRHACAELSSIDLSDCVIYSTCEPCPMCFSAIHWARISRIVFGACISDAAAAGFNELPISNAQLTSLSSSPIQIHPHFLQTESRQLFSLWLSHPTRKAY